MRKKEERVILPSEMSADYIKILISLFFRENQLSYKKNFFSKLKNDNLVSEY